MPPWLHHWPLFPLGLALGILGTLVGAGGGFLLVPILLLLYPAAAPETITSISLAVVCGNATSGSISYARMKRIDYRSGLLFALASIPGAVLGALTTGLIPRRGFDILFGAALLIIAALLGRRAVAALRGPAPPPRPEPDKVQRRGLFNLPVGLAVSAAVGFISSVLGVGGGIMHVPALVYLLDFPVHIATATSHFVLAITAAVGTLVHILSGAFDHGGAGRTIVLSIGVILGAPIGARLSRRLGESWIILALSAALVLAGIRLVILGLR